MAQKTPTKINPQRLGIVNPSHMSQTQSTIRNVPKHSKDVYLPEIKIAITGKRTKK